MVYSSAQLRAVVSYSKPAAAAAQPAHPSELPEADAVGRIHVADAVTGRCIAVIGPGGCVTGGDASAAAAGGAGDAGGRGARGGASGNKRGRTAGGGSGSGTAGVADASASSSAAAAARAAAAMCEGDGADPAAEAALTDVSALFVDEAGLSIFTGTHKGVAYRWGPEDRGEAGYGGRSSGGGGSLAG
jgi:hypothetical protein